MSETNMPAVEAINTEELELGSYELAFHVLPTVAEGEVLNVFESLKNNIKKAGGEIIEEETPQRFDLAYDIDKYLEGKNRKFSSAYFGWVRFSLTSAQVAELTESIEATKELLRYLLIKLTKVEEQNSFQFHESIVSNKVQTIAEEDVSGEVKEEVVVEEEPKTDTEEAKEVEKAPEVASGEEEKETV
jgi:ribosomal protein S6